MGVVLAMTRLTGEPTSTDLRKNGSSTTRAYSAHRKSCCKKDLLKLVRHYSAKADKNQPDIVKVFRNAGASVGLIHRAGSGVPDLIVGYRGFDVQVEIKMPQKLKLTDKELKYHETWNGHKVAVVSSESEALGLIANIDMYAELMEQHKKTVAWS